MEVTELYELYETLHVFDSKPYLGTDTKNLGVSCR